MIFLKKMKYQYISVIIALGRYYGAEFFCREIVGAFFREILVVDAIRVRLRFRLAVARRISTQSSLTLPVSL